jgi:hypothetical protein
MVLWIDADACPGPIKEIVFRAAERARIQTVLVANHAMRVPKSRYIRAVQVESGFDIADARILQDVAAGDLVVTADIPLAARVVSAAAIALNPRGTLYTADNVADHLSRRNLMDELRSSGTITGGPPALNKTNLQAFANALDKFLSGYARSRDSAERTAR